MTIAVGVEYKTLGKNGRKIRNVIGEIYPKPLIHIMFNGKYKVIRVDLGDIDADFNEESAGFRMLYRQ